MDANDLVRDLNMIEKARAHLVRVYANWPYARAAIQDLNDAAVRVGQMICQVENQAESKEPEDATG